MMIETVMVGNERDGMLSLKGIMSFQVAADSPHSPPRRGGEWSFCSVKQFIVILSLFFLLVQSALAADAKQIYEEATNALYNLDFTTAEHGFETLTHDYSDNPDYWNALASAIWVRITFNQQKLNIESFSGRSLGTRDSKDTVNPADEKRLRETVGIAIQKAETILKKNPNDLRALYAKGISQGTLAAFEATVKRSYVSAHGKAKEAHDLHQQVLKLDPTFNDAQLGVGAYDYVVGVLPGLLRFVLSPLGVRSAGKDIGIQELEAVAAKGKIASIDAKMILVVVYTREKRYEEALKLLEEIHSRYPRNFPFELATASLYGKMQRWNDAERVYEQILGKIHSSTDGYERLRQARVLSALGMNDINNHQFEKATGAFQQVLSTNDATANEKGRAHLWLGKLFDSKGDRTQALEHYEALQALDCNPDLKAEAQRYKRHPFAE